MTGTWWVLGIDPGAVHSGMVLCRVGTDTDRAGAPELEPVDGLTIHRSPSEDPILVTGQGFYAARVAVEILGLLDLHDVPEEQVRLVCIEGYTLPSGWVSHQAMVDSVQLNRVLGYLEATWPEHYLVAPAGLWPSGKTGWDADPEAVPECLTGRRPTTWSQGAGSRGTHQRSAFCMARAGWRRWRAQGGLVAAAPAATSTPVPVLVTLPEASAKPTPVERVAGLVRAGGAMSVSALLDAATQVWPEGTTSDRVALALASAMELRPETDRQRMQARLEAKAAELEGTTAGS
jgi:hypothetical protein